MVDAVRWGYGDDLVDPIRFAGWRRAVHGRQLTDSSLEVGPFNNEVGLRFVRGR